MKSIVSSSLAVFLAVGLLGAGCRKQNSSPPLNSDQPAQTNAAPAAAQSPEAKTDITTNTNSVEQRVARLLDAFQTAPEATRTRIQSAAASIRAGNEREAVVQLKLVDADSELTIEQVQSIKDLITTIRRK
jgi:hypothetical protein